MADDTAEYFEEHSQDYHPRRLRVAVRWIARIAAEGDSLLDVGCGTGLVLEAMRDGAGITRLAGCDPAAAALEKAAERVDADLRVGSILDEAFADGLGEHRFVTMAAVLHHVVAGTRRASRDQAVLALRATLARVAPGGRLVIMEPTYRPRWVMTVLFWSKRALIALFGNRRLELGRWNNLGAPLVAYYSPDEVQEMVAEAGGRVIRSRDRTASLRRLPRAVGVRGRWFTTVMAVPIRD
ncbi:MAG: class I SAM-dependent methyltransferase [Actinobacteria bacterium]|nr:class I SAM-dependent methyltransferase [Actinomycetota bacterium]